MTNNILLPTHSDEVVVFSAAWLEAGTADLRREARGLDAVDPGALFVVRPHGATWGIGPVQYELLAPDEMPRLRSLHALRVHTVDTDALTHIRLAAAGLAPWSTRSLVRDGGACLLGDDLPAWAAYVAFALRGQGSLLEPEEAGEAGSQRYGEVQPRAEEPMAPKGGRRARSARRRRRGGQRGRQDEDAPAGREC
ncbi:hypothetical protein [Sabulicella rubraurantiaca]|uniref:hypothetical protein n=1 Tax=Sabulicella rubraurantiaca TaxID=2811429 RepID=UPI001A95FD81|nr:hypothetical protein [Sabulicella rubraurantiaca]